MSARSELAATIEGALDRSHGIIAWAGPAQEDIAYAILAAGYSKPRTITTAEELDALPVGSVVLHHGRTFQHYPSHPAPFDEYQKWKCADGGFVRSTKDGSMILPAAVIHEPAA